MNLAQIIEPHDAELVALISRGRETTYGALREQVARARGGLAAAGIGRGDRVVILCATGRFFVVSYLAVVGLGAVAVPLNPSSPAPELIHEITAVEAKGAIVGPFAATAWRNIARSAVPSVSLVVEVEGGVPGAELTFDDLLAAEPRPIVETELDELAVMIFTSGTGGPPRAAMLSHRNLLANIEQARSDATGVGRGDVVYGVLPLFHIFGLNVALGVSLARGATIVLIQRFDPSTALDTIRDRGVTVVMGAPPLWLAFSHFDQAPADAFASVRLALSGAAKMPDEAIRRLRDHFGLELREGYGLTEASPVVTSQAGIPPRIGSVGKVLGGMEVRLVDESGHDALEGDAGEVWVKGPNVFQGYWNDPEATARALTPDGWLRTGDVAVTDDDGYLYLVDRVKDLIIVSGFNVYPAEVEDVIAEHPDVADVGVVGVPHPHHGEAVKAFVVLEPGASISEEMLIEWSAGQMARYKCPSKVLFVDELPRGTGGKLLRRQLT
jgi:long-chain acyl-CoA synthetase